jgi:hypothetical protein
MYQAKGQGVTYKSICESVFTAYGRPGMGNRDTTLPSHLKSGHDNVPPDVVDAARQLSFEDAVSNFQNCVIKQIAYENEKAFVYAIKAILREDPVSPETIIGYRHGYEKANLLKSDKFQMTPLLASLFKYAITEVSNADCSDSLKCFEKNYISSADSSKQLFIDHSDDLDEEESETHVPLQKSIQCNNFNHVFHKVSSLVISGITHPSTADIYCADIGNGKLRFNSVKNFLADNIGTYVFSRTKIKQLEQQSAGALGAHALIQFQKTYKENTAAVLGELLLYIFLEQELHAPKIMSKMEFAAHGGLVSRSDGVHLLTTTEFGRPFNQLVFGASNIQGSLQGAVDRAFERILKIEENADTEFSMVADTAQHILFDDDTNEYIRDLMIPRKPYSHKPDMAFGLFLGYTLIVNPPQTDSALYRLAAENQLKADIEEIKDYISHKIQEYHLEGYSFYCYVLPFNDAPNERTTIIDEMLEGK